MALVIILIFTFLNLFQIKFVVWKQLILCVLSSGSCLLSSVSSSSSLSLFINEIIFAHKGYSPCPTPTQHQRSCWSLNVKGGSGAGFTAVAAISGFLIQTYFCAVPLASEVFVSTCTWSTWGFRPHSVAATAG